MKKLRLTYILTVGLLLTGCSEEKFAPTADYSEGKPATLDMTITVPEGIKITSRAIDPEMGSKINELAMIGFEKNSGRKEYISLTGYLTALDPTALAGRTYKLSEAVPTLSGKYEMFVIANWSSAYGISESELQSLDRDQLASLTFNNADGNHELTGANGLPMSQHYDEFQINEGDNILTGERSVHLVRGVAHIDFIFKNGPATAGGQPNFKPEKFSVYRVPATMSAFNLNNKIDGTDNTITLSEIPVTEVTDDGNACFSFFMLEDMQDKAARPGTAATNLSERESWDYTNGADATLSNRVFTHAPANATYVVVEGSYSGPASKNETGNYDDKTYSGTVRYIIHLGNFNTTNGGSYDNYNVGRNEYHTYTITVNGAHSIFANVKVQGSNYATEGYLTEANQVNLDAHYAKVMLKIPKVSFLGDGSDVVRLSTPKNGFSTNLVPISDIKASAASRADNTYDYKWIQFQKPSKDNVDNNTFPPYAGINLTTGECLNQNGTKWGYITDLVTNPEEYAYEDGDNYIVAAFVDEYAYIDDPTMPYSNWCGFTKNQRRMVLNPSDRFDSDDLQSSYKSGSSFEINQRPMATIYDINGSAMDDETFNPFCMEQIEELSTGCGEASNIDAANRNYFSSAVIYDAAANAIDRGTESKDRNGQNNTKVMFIDTNLLTDKYDTGFWYSSGTSTYAYKPCTYLSETIVAHNRDFDGDGTISEEELRWYVPTFTQYIASQVGQGIFNDDLRLFKRYMMTVKSSSVDRAYPHYLTSSRSTIRVYWQDTGSQGYASHLNDSWFTPYQNVRFARNVGRGTDAFKSDYTPCITHDTNNHVITLTNKRLARTYYWDEPYPIHSVSDEANRLPEKLEYYPTIMRWTSATDNTEMATWTNKYIKDNSEEQIMANITREAVAQYKTAAGETDADYTELPDGWRIPNMRELQVLLISGAYKEIAFVGYTAEDPYDQSKNGSFHGGANYSSTFINTTNWASRPWPFMIVSNVPNHPNGTNPGGAALGTILVRDYVDASSDDSGTTTSSVKSRKSSANNKARRVARRNK